jgi:tripartite-type tricarboxylate transporter receptor subunit TctC
VAEKIQRDIARALAEPDVKEKFSPSATSPSPRRASSSTPYIQSETARFAGIIRTAGAQLD